MADVITRLRLESGEFDNKVKRATQGLLRMEEECRRVGGTLGVLEKDQKDYVSSLGRMETVSKSARGKLAELTKAYEELAVQYRRLSDEEKNGDFGKALNSSLAQLKDRISEAKTELKDIDDEMKGTGSSGDELGSVLDALGSKLGISTKALGAWGVALAAAGAALKVATDAFKQNEIVMDDYNRALESSSAVYDGFLNALNTGDISGFLQNINDIVHAAGEAYDAMDELGTFNAFNQINVARTRAEMMEAIAAYRGGTGSRDAAKAAADAYKAELSARGKREQEDYESAVNQLAASRGVDAELLREILAGDYKTYEQYKDRPLSGVKKSVDYVGMARDKGMSGEDLVKKYTYSTAVPASKEEKIGQMLRLLADVDLDALQAKGAKAYNTDYEVSTVDRQMIRMLGVGGSKTATEAWSPIAMGAVGMVDLNPVAPMRGFEEAYNFDFGKSLERVNKDRQEPNETEMKMTDLLDGISGGIGNMVGGLEQLGIDVPEGLKSAIGAIQGVSSILTGISSILTVIQTASMIDAIKLFAGGGVVKAATGYSVPGNFRSGDRVPALLNSGEVVLNRAQQGNLLSQMGGMGMNGNYEAQPYVDGEKIWLGVSNYLRRIGRGEIVTSRG